MKKTQREIAQEMYIWNAENYWKGVGLGILKISSRFLWIFYFYENLDKKKPYFMYDEKKNLKI